MYIPRHFAITDLETLLDVMRANSFATFVSDTDDGLQATHIPLLVDESDGKMVLTGHFARANPHWKALDGGRDALAIFAGPHAYISPSWYGPGPAVPTWDYVAVHAYGKPVLIEETAERLEILRCTVETYESGMDVPWSVNDQDGEYIAKLAQGTVAFTMKVDKLEGKAKLGQNRPEQQGGVVDALSRSESQAERDIAHLISSANGLP
jgi:transcriptional regulator